MENKTKTNYLEDYGLNNEEEKIIFLAEEAVQGDTQAAIKLGMILAPMILEEVQVQMSKEIVEASKNGTPVFRRGGKFLERV